jgi:RhtB (resistance to homoserine/threonine) family protein
MGPNVAAFVSVAAVLTIAPGADTALVTKFALSRGQRAALAATLGIATGCTVHATFSALGLSVILARSAAAYHTVRLVGAAYLVYLGARMLWETRGSKTPAAGAYEEAPPSPSGSALGAFGTGLLTNLLNPKVAIFYLTFLPQFVDATQPVLPQSLLLAGTHVAMGIVWLAAYARFLSLFRRVLMRPVVKRWMERATGAVLIAFGLKVATAGGDSN